MTKVTVSVDGLRELDEAMIELTKAAQRGVMRRVLMAASVPIVEDARAHAPVGEHNRPRHKAGRLKWSIHAGTRLTSRQKSQHKKFSANEKASAEIFIGPSGVPEAIQQEFGNENHDPQPFLRPAWDAHKQQALDIIKEKMGVEIAKAAERARRKAARLLAKAGK